MCKGYTHRSVQVNFRPGKYRLVLDVADSDSGENTTLQTNIEWIQYQECLQFF